MLNRLIDKRHIVYGSSIVFSRGLEYLVLFFAAYYFSKEDYGGLEYYKKIIEVGSSIIAFGFPALIMSYTKSKESKAHFFLLAILFVIGLGVLLGLFFAFTPWLFLVVPFMFYALFFTGGITHSYLLVQYGSNTASYFKIIVSLFFYTIVFCSIYFYGVTDKAFVYVNYILVLPLMIYAMLQFNNEQIVVTKLKKYWKLFKGLLLSSFSLVVSNFANMMFLYTDIFVIKLLSKNADVDIANYSFSLNIAALILLIPMTLVQVDIEKLKTNRAYVAILNKKILLLTVIITVILLLFFVGLTHRLFVEYKEVFFLFLIILLAKSVQSFSPLYGAMLVIQKNFKKIFYINFITLLFNLIFSYLFFEWLALYGVAFASLSSLILRQLLLYQSYKKNLTIKSLEF